MVVEQRRIQGNVGTDVFKRFTNKYVASRGKIMNAKNLKAGFLIALSTLSCPAGAQQMVAEVNMQATSSSCQSYAFSVMLTLKDSVYGSTAKELHETEKQIRKLIEKEAKGGKVEHKHWDTAIAKFTEGAYKLERKYLADSTAWFNKVRELTTPTLDDLTRLTFEKAVAVSVNAVDGSNYGNGHVITVIDIAAKGPAFEIEYLNGGIKTDSDEGFEDHICREGAFGDETYAVGIRRTTNYDVKSNSVYWIEAVK
jgi:hypothetical protein